MGEPYRHASDSPQPSAEGRLDSWKEIAAYLKRSVSTVQRWERFEGLPAHRHLHSSLGTVYAYKGELDAWWNDRRPQLEEQEQAPAPTQRRPSLWVVAPLALVLVLGILVGLNVGSMRDRLLGRAAQPRIESLAVLPLQNLSGNPDQEYFADGITDGLITDLAKLGTLRVISRTSSMQYRGAKKPLPEIARELNVDAVVEGSVLRSGNRVRVNVQLLHGPSDRHLWAETYERDLQDIMTLQSEVTRAIAHEIRIQLTPQAQARLAERRPVHPEAHEAYLLGRYFWNKRTVEGFHEAVEHFEQAVQKDPNNALAYSGLADAYVLYGQFPELPIQETRARAVAAATRALKLDDTLGEAHTSLAFIHAHYDWDWRPAEKEFKRAIELNPSYATAHHWYAYYWVSQGRMKEALAEIHRARELDPLSLIINTDMAEMFYYAGQHDQAIQQARKVLEMDPNFALGRQILAWAYLEKHLEAEAILELQTAISASGRGSQLLPSVVGSLGVAYARAGRRAEAERVLRELKAGSHEEPHFQVAWIHTALGEKDKAFASLEKTYQQRAGALILLKALWFLEPLHSDSRFQDLVRRVGLPQ